MGKSILKKTIDIPLISKDGETFKLTKEEFENKSSQKNLMLRYYELIAMMDKAVFVFSQERIELNTKKLFNYVYAKTQLSTNGEDIIDNEDVQRIFGYPVPVSLWESFISQTYLDEITNEPVQYEELEDIAKGVENEYYYDKHQKEIEKLDFNERYQNGYFDTNNIFDCFGFCWSNDTKKNEPLVPDSYKGLLLRLHDYRFNENPIEHVKYFDDIWIENFLTYLKNEGYSTFVPKYYHPFNIEQFRIKFIESERNPYRYSGFEKVVKHLKRYIFLMQKYKIITYERNPKFIDVNEYVGRNVQTTPYTRREHSLTINEFKLLATTNFKDVTLNIARDMFVIAVLGGGFRGEEFYNHELTLEERDGEYIIHIFYSKTLTYNINPVFGSLEEVIKRNKGKFPIFLKKNEFNKSLKIIAEKLDFDRIIKSPNTFMNSDKKQISHVLKDIFSIYFARKTCVSLLSFYGLSDEEIIEFTSHSKTETLKHYKAKRTLDDKKRIIERMQNRGIQL